MAIIPFKDRLPKIAQNVFIAPDSWITGDVTIGEDVSIFFGSVLRGDINKIVVGKGTNIQEHSMLHTSHGLGDCVVGEYVTVGHRAIVHGCTIGNHCIIGMGATILDGAEIGEFSIVGANSLVTMHKKFPPKSMIMGSPAKVVREITEADIKGIEESAKHYIETGREYLRHFLAI